MKQDCDFQGLEQLVLQQLPDLMKLAVRLTGGADAAEELVQEALLRVTRGWPGFQGKSQFRTWLYRIVINVFRDRLAARPADESLADDVEDDRQSEAASAAIAGELGTIVAQRVSSLPPRQREVLILAAYEGLSTREIAEALEITEANVHATLHLARTRLRKQLASYLAEK